MQQQLADIQGVVEDVLKLAKQQGATQAEASMSKIQGIAVSAFTPTKEARSGFIYS